MVTIVCVQNRIERKKKKKMSAHTPETVGDAEIIAPPERTSELHDLLGIEDLHAFFKWWDANYSDQRRLNLAMDWFDLWAGIDIQQAFTLSRRVLDIREVDPEGCSADVLELLMLSEWAVCNVYGHLSAEGRLPRRGCADSSKDTKLPTKKRSREDDDEDADDESSSEDINPFTPPPAQQQPPLTPPLRRMLEETGRRPIIVIEDMNEDLEGLDEDFIRRYGQL